MDEQYLDWGKVKNFARQLRKQNLDMITETIAIMWYRHHSGGMMCPYKVGHLVW